MLLPHLLPNQEGLSDYVFHPNKGKTKKKIGDLRTGNRETNSEKVQGTPGITEQQRAGQEDLGGRLTE